MTEYNQLTSEERAHADRIIAHVRTLPSAEQEYIFQRSNDRSTAEKIAAAVGAVSIVRKGGGLALWIMKFLARRGRV